MSIDFALAAMFAVYVTLVLWTAYYAAKRRLVAGIIVAVVLFIVWVFDPAIVEMWVNNGSSVVSFAVSAIVFAAANAVMFAYETALSPERLIH